jgi:UDP-N-acetylmuramoyl-tripeptide--D-alanyl-D-alanine ligase
MEITGARLAVGMIPDEPAAIYHDTRIMPEGAWFIALVGPQFDGHDFIGDAFSQGALGCIVTERASYPIASTSFPLLAVDDTQIALGQLARNWRKRLSPKVILVIANKSEQSNAAAELCASSLQKKFETELWRLVGVSFHAVLTKVLGLEPGIQALVIEIAPLDLEQLRVCISALVPTVLVISSCGLDHLHLTNSQDKFCESLKHIIASLDEKRTSLVVASRESMIRDMFGKFAGKKEIMNVSLPEELSESQLIEDQETTLPLEISEINSDAWAARMVLKQFSF